MRLVKYVKVGEDGAIVFTQAGVRALSSSPGGLNVYADVVMENHVTAEVDIKSALFGTQARAAVAGSGRKKRSTAQEDITLLGRGKLGKEQESTNWDKK